MLVEIAYSRSCMTPVLTLMPANCVVLTLLASVHEIFEMN